MNKAKNYSFKFVITNPKYEYKKTDFRKTKPYNVRLNFIVTDTVYFDAMQIVIYKNFQIFQQ